MTPPTALQRERIDRAKAHLLITIIEWGSELSEHEVRLAWNNVLRAIERYRVAIRASAKEIP